jgi:flagellar protein FliS
MTSYASTSSGAYRANAVLTASSTQLIVMLYDGARRFLHRAGVAMAEKDIPTAHANLVAAEHILRHLRNTLDMSHGEIPANLGSIYGFCLRQCQKARFDQNPQLLEQVSGLLGQLRSSWAAIAEQESKGHNAMAAAGSPVAVLAG